MVNVLELIRGQPSPTTTNSSNSNYLNIPSNDRSNSPAPTIIVSNSSNSIAISIAQTTTSTPSPATPMPRFDRMNTNSNNAGTKKIRLPGSYYDRCTVIVASMIYVLLSLLIVIFVIVVFWSMMRDGCMIKICCVLTFVIRNVIYILYIKAFKSSFEVLLKV